MTPSKELIRVTICPKNGLRVRKPNGQLLDPAGEAVIWSSYWRRRELEGDIEQGSIKPKVVKPVASKAKAVQPAATNAKAAPPEAIVSTPNAE